MSKNDVDLKIDWASHAAAKFACENWHYSKSLPVGKITKVGVWEDGAFTGVVIFGRGANKNMLASFNIGQNEGCELVRVALKKHQTPVSKIVAIALKFLKRASPRLRIVVSYADPEQGHAGGIYQAGNWVYSGVSAKAVKVFYKGLWAHKKTVDDAGVNQAGLPKKIVQGKHRYLMPLDKAMRKQIEPLRKPYPKKENTRAGSVNGSTSDDLSESRGSNPTPALTEV